SALVEEVGYCPQEEDEKTMGQETQHGQGQSSYGHQDPALQLFAPYDTHPENNVGEYEPCRAEYQANKGTDGEALSLRLCRNRAAHALSNEIHDGRANDDQRSHYAQASGEPGASESQGGKKNSQDKHPKERKQDDFQRGGN